MKGVLQVIVEVDYEQMIQEGDLESLSKFTGKTDPQEIMNAHMNIVGRELGDVLKDRPMIGYNITGQLVDEEAQAQTEESEPAQDGDAPAEDTTDAWDGNTEEAIEAEEAEEETYPTVPPEEPIEDAEIVEDNTTVVGNSEVIDVDYTAMLDDDLDNVSTEWGIPQEVILSEMVNQQMRKRFSVPDGQSIDKYKGFKVTVQGMGEAYEIRYDSYDKGQSNSSFVREVK